MIPYDDLRTSFAYRMYYRLVKIHEYKGSLTAVTGKIQHNTVTGRALVEHEDLIDLNLDYDEINKAKRAAMKEAVGGVLLPRDQETAEYKAKMIGFQSSDAGQDLMKKCKDVRDRRNSMEYKLKFDAAKNRYGKLLYRVRKGNVAIASRYGDPSSEGGLKPGAVLYAGVMEPPLG